MLPLSGKPKVLVCGAAANSLDLLNGAWTHTWLGVNEKNSTHTTQNKKTIARAINDEIGHANFEISKGHSLTANANLEETVRLAKQSDYIVACLGEAPATEIPGNINTLALEDAQVELNGLYKIFMEQVEKPLIELSLRAHRGNQVKTAKMLGINRNTLKKKIDCYRIRVRNNNTITPAGHC